MSGRRLIALLVGIIGLLVLVAAVVFLVIQPGQQDDTRDAPVSEVAEGEALEPTSTPFPTVDPAARIIKVVVSFQTVPRGWQMTEAELEMDERLASEVPSNVITKIEDAVGLYARQEIFQGQTLTTDNLVNDPTLLGIENYGPSSLIPSGSVAMAVPMDRLSSVAYGLSAGDHVDIMLSFTLNALDQEFQTLLFNSATFYFQETGEDGETGQSSIFVIDPYGRFETLPTGDMAHIGPAEDEQRPMPVSVILQSAKVIQVGLWRPPLPVQPPTPTPEPDAPTPTPGGPPPTPTPSPPNVLLLAMTPQEQLFMKFAIEVSADIDFALRSKDDEQVYTVQSVDIGFLLQQFEVDIPPNAVFSVGGIDTTSLEAGEVQTEGP